ncbi:DUF2163 domain-containing protein, partial [bacterium]
RLSALAHIQGRVLTLAVLVTITREDGYQIGFTSSQRRIVFDGVEHRPTDALALSALQQTAGQGIDNADATGAITDDRVTDQDLDDGLWDGAEFVVRFVNRLDPSAGAMVRGSGQIGQVSTEDGRWSLELRGLGQLAKQTVGQTTSATCRCRRLGEPRCGVDVAAFTTPHTVAEVFSRAKFRISGQHAQAASVDWWERGLARCVTGANAGLTREVKLAPNATPTGTIIELRTPCPRPIEVGDTFELVAGCDRTIAMCRLKFANANRFRGEPDLPTNDTYLQQGRPPG